MYKLFELKLVTESFIRLKLLAFLWSLSDSTSLKISWTQYFERSW